MKNKHLTRTLLLAPLAAATIFAQTAPLPNRPDSVKFAAIGDNGTGDRPQYEIAQQMTDAHRTFPFDLVIMLGDNMYGGQRPGDFVKKFEQPYAALLSAGVRFQASLGNHDRPENVSYKPFNMKCQQERPVLRPRQYATGSEAAGLDRRVAARRARGLEDLLFPSSALLECPPPRVFGRSACVAGANLHQVRGQCRHHRSRPCLRAADPAEGHLLLRRGFGRTAEEGQHQTIGCDRRVL
ncbi:MAG: hypothetical protein DMF98_08235 [Acidobacteria bacterium]|nr:MAG: hypothetical protein DMF98_08235 [Acidobacteriota bacterium]